MENKISKEYNGFYYDFNKKNHRNENKNNKNIEFMNHENNIKNKSTMEINKLNLLIEDNNKPQKINSKIEQLDQEIFHLKSKLKIIIEK